MTIMAIPLRSLSLIIAIAFLSSCSADYGKKSRKQSNDETPPVQELAESVQVQETLTERESTDPEGGESAVSGEEGLDAGSEDESTSDEENATGSGGESAETTVEEESEDVVTTVIDVTADSYTAVIDQCISGYERHLTESDSEINLQQGDKGCRFRLLTLQTGAESFDFSAVTTWEQDSVFQVTGSQGSVASFHVVRTLKPVIEAEETVRISYQFATQGRALGYTPTIPTTIEVAGTPRLDLEIEMFDVMVDDRGAGLFQFTFSCPADLAEASCRGFGQEPLQVAIHTQPSAFQADYRTCRAMAASGQQIWTEAVGETVERLATPYLVGPARLFDPANAMLVVTLAEEREGGACKFLFLK